MQGGTTCFSYRIYLCTGLNVVFMYFLCVLCSYVVQSGWMSFLCILYVPIWFNLVECCWMLLNVVLCILYVPKWYRYSFPKVNLYLLVYAAAQRNQWQPQHILNDPHFRQECLCPGRIVLCKQQVITFQAFIMQRPCRSKISSQAIPHHIRKSPRYKYYR